MRKSCLELEKPMFPTLLFFSYMFLAICYTGCMCMFMCLSAGAMAHVWRSENSLRCWAFFSAFETVFLLFTVAYFRLAGSQASGSSLVSVSHLTIGTLGLQLCATVTSFYMGCWYSSSGPHAGLTGTLLIEAYPWPFTLCLLRINVFHVYTLL